MKRNLMVLYKAKAINAANAGLNCVSLDQIESIDLFFTKKSGSNDISKITDIEAVKRSIRNLVLINF